LLVVSAILASESRNELWAEQNIAELSSRLESGGEVNPLAGSGPVGYDAAETWKEEFKRRPGERILLRDGTALEPNQRFEDPEYCASLGKQRQVATVSFFMLPGLDGVEAVYPVSDRPDTVIVEDRRGGRAAYDYAELLASDDSGAVEKTPAQMGAVMAGERIHVERRASDDSLAEQYAISYDDALASKDAPALIRATDAFMAYAKEHEIYPGFSDPGLTEFLAGSDYSRSDRKRERLEAVVLKDAPELVEELTLAIREGRSPSESEARRLIERVRSLGRDVSTYRIMMRDDLARAEADMELVRKVLVLLLSGEEARESVG
jgi:hypothetical protein